MTNETQIYLATIFYTDKANARKSIKALVVGAAPEEAIQEALTIARSLPDCVEVLCGMLEPADADLLAAVLRDLADTIPAEDGPNARADDRQWDGTAEHARVLNAQRAPGTTVH